MVGKRFITDIQDGFYFFIVLTGTVITNGLTISDWIFSPENMK